MLRASRKLDPRVEPVEPEGDAKVLEATGGEPGIGSMSGHAAVPPSSW